MNIKNKVNTEDNKHNTFIITLPDWIRGLDENQGYIIWPTFVSLNVAYKRIEPSIDDHIAFWDLKISSVRVGKWKYKNKKKWQ